MRREQPYGLESVWIKCRSWLSRGRHITRPPSLHSNRSDVPDYHQTRRPSVLWPRVCGHAADAC